jgi:hypothetical protein
MFKYWMLLFAFTAQSLYALTTLHVTLSSDNNPGGIGEVGDLRYCLNTMNQGLIRHLMITPSFLIRP